MGPQDGGLARGGRQAGPGLKQEDCDWGALLCAAARAGLTPAEFWRLTFWEFSRFMRGHEEARRAEFELVAQHAAWTISPHTKHGVTAKQLLGPRWGGAEPERDSETEAVLFAGETAVERKARRKKERVDSRKAARARELAELEAEELARKRR